MTNLNIIGDSGKRKSKFDPDLAERINNQVEAEERRQKLEKKLRKKIEVEKGKEDDKIDNSATRKLTAPNFTDVMFLEGEFGRDINEKVQGKYGKYSAIKNVVFTDDIVKGSNPFYAVAVQEFLPENIRVATQADLERILKMSSLQLKEQYEDSSLVWRSNQEPNKYLAKDIYRQFKSNGIELIEEKAYVIPLFTLKLREDENSPHKLAFDIVDLTLQSYFEAPILNEASRQKFNSDDIDEKIGLPKRVGTNGDRTLYTRNSRDYTIKNSGVCWLCLNWDLYANSNGELLASSGASGRVVCVRAEGTTLKNLGWK